MIETWEEFKKEKKIWAEVGEHDKIPNGYYPLTDELDEMSEQKEFEELITHLKGCVATDYEIEILTNEDGEYAGCYLESVTINNVKFSATMEGDVDNILDNESGVWSQLSIEKLK